MFHTTAITISAIAAAAAVGWLIWRALPRTDSLPSLEAIRNVRRMHLHYEALRRRHQPAEDGLVREMRGLDQSHKP